MTDLAMPAIDRAAVRAALEEFRAVVGPQWVFADPATLDSYRDPYSIVAEDAFLPGGVVVPDGVEQIQQILAIANRHRVPLWPLSCGKNLGYGGAAPRVAGTVMLDLKRMNRILEVNEAFGYALVEPGVSYFDLYQYIQARGYKLWLDVPSPGWGSVLGNALERGVGYTPYGDHFMMQCGMEVVLANGEVVRTGMGALPGNTTWQLFKYGFGPYVDGIFTQSNFGVVTKLGIWLMPEPPGYRPFMITFPREDDIEPIVEILRPLKINLVIPNAAVITNLLFEASIKTHKSAYHTGPGPLPDSAMRRIMADQDIGMWNFYAALYGPDPIMDAAWGVIRDAFSAIPGAKFYLAADRPDDVTMTYRAKLMAGVPNLTEFSYMNWIPGGAHIDFAPVSPTTGPQATRQFRMISERMREFGFDYFGAFVVGWRELHHIIALIFNKTDPAERARARELFGLLIDEAAAAGFGEYRTHLAFMDQIAGTYGYNYHALQRLNERLKDHLDPNGILAPGKQGLWPASMRGAVAEPPPR